MLLFTRTIRKAFCRRLYRHFVAFRCCAAHFCSFLEKLCFQPLPLHPSSTLLFAVSEGRSSHGNNTLFYTCFSYYLLSSFCHERTYMLLGGQ